MAQRRPELFCDFQHWSANGKDRVVLSGCQCFEALADGPVKVFA